MIKRMQKTIELMINSTIREGVLPRVAADGLARITENIEDEKIEVQEDDQTCE